MTFVPGDKARPAQIDAYRQCVNGCLIMATVILMTISSCEAEASRTRASHLDVLVDIADAEHLLNRSGIGAHPVDVLRLQGLTRQQAVQRIIDGIHSRPETAMPAWVDGAPAYMTRGSMQPKERRLFNRQRDREFNDLRQWWLSEMIATTSPQTERLVLFWHNHFVSAYPALDNQSTSIARQNRLFRRHAGGNFRELLSAIIRDAAMLDYLDNRSSHKKSPNENLARELMELFTLGEGNYSESDVKNAARALTGYTFAPAHNMKFRFESWRHDHGQKEIFGKSGNFNGDDLLALILDRPETAEFIAGKFWHHFVNSTSQNPVAIPLLAQRFRESGYEIKVLFSELLQRPEFWSAENRHAVVKSPIDLVIGTVRTHGQPVSDFSSLANSLQEQGQNLFAAPNVAGWAGGTNWVTPNRLLSRMQWLDNYRRWHREKEDTDGAIDDLKTAARSANAATEMMAGGAVTMTTIPEQGSNMTAMSAVGDKDAKRADRRANRVVVRLASDDFHQAPRSRVELLKNKRVVWLSREFNLRPGRDTLKLGLSDSENTLAWKNYRPKSAAGPAALPAFDEVRVHFLNDDNDVDGDRNMFVDWVRIGQLKLNAVEGQQFSDCPPEAAYDSGSLFCSGYVSIMTAGKSSQRSVALAGNGLLAAKVFIQWIHSPDDKLANGRARKNADIVFTLLDVNLGDRHWDNLAIKLTRNRRGDLIVAMDRYGCWPDCFTRWPDCSVLHADDSYSREIRFRFGKRKTVAGGRQARQMLSTGDSCKGSDLQLLNRQLAAALMSNIMGIYEASRNDQKLDRNANYASFVQWQPYLTDLAESVSEQVWIADALETLDTEKTRRAVLVASDAKLLADSASLSSQPVVYPAGLAPSTWYPLVRELLNTHTALPATGLGSLSMATPGTRQRLNPIALGPKPYASAEESPAKIGTQQLAGLQSMQRRLDDMLLDARFQLK